MNEVAEAINNLAAVMSSIYEHKLLMKHSYSDNKDYCRILKNNMVVNLGLLTSEE